MSGFFASANTLAPSEDFIRRAISARKAQGLSARKTATALGLDHTRYGRYERGQSKVPFDVAVLISDFFDIPLILGAPASEQYQAGFHAGLQAAQACIASYARGASDER